MESATSDFYLSCFLRLHGLEIKELRDFDDRKLFVFEDTEEFQRLKREYYWNQAMVDPLNFKQAIRELKGMIMENKF